MTDEAGDVAAMATRRVRPKAIVANGRHNPRRRSRKERQRRCRRRNPELFAPVGTIRVPREAMNAALARIEMKKTVVPGAGTTVIS